MALTAYQTSVQNLLHDPQAQFYSTSLLTTFINEARGQIALEGECIRSNVAFNTINATELYQMSTVPAPSAAILAGPISIRSISYNSRTFESRPWDYFNFYFRNIAKPAAGTPTAWCPFQQGTTGSFYISPIPNGVFALEIDAVWLPILLVNDSTAEAIPYPWTDAIKFYAAYLCLKDGQRTIDADRMFQLYETYMTRARGGVTPLVQPDSFPGSLASRAPTPGMAPPTHRNPVAQPGGN